VPTITKETVGSALANRDKALRTKIIGELAFKERGKETGVKSGKKPGRDIGTHTS
jgi:hypothetical protein